MVHVFGCPSSTNNNKSNLRHNRRRRRRDTDDARLLTTTTTTTATASCTTAAVSSFTARRLSCSFLSFAVILLFVCCFCGVASAAGGVGHSGSNSSDRQHLPQLYGAHFRVTVVEAKGFLDITTNQQQREEDGNISNATTTVSATTTTRGKNHSKQQNLKFSGYLIDILTAVAREDRANFTFELRTPSGHGTDCNPRQQQRRHQRQPEQQQQQQQQQQRSGNNDDEANKTIQIYNWADATMTTSTAPPAPRPPPAPYDAVYYSQYNCATNDVNHEYIKASPTAATREDESDMYLGMFYISPHRQLLNHFTIPFLPPYQGTLAMFGTLTGVRTIEELVQQQTEGRITKPACANKGGASSQFLEQSLPGIKLRKMGSGHEEIYRAFDDGTCDVYIFDAALAAQFVLQSSLRNECTANGKPIGVIGEPMAFGLSHYSIGIGHHVPVEVVDTISYWMNILMICNPLDEDGPCPEGNFAEFFQGRGGTGTECGYVLFPYGEGSDLKPGEIVGIVVGAIAFAVVIFTAWHCHRLKRQEQRYRKRFVQQIARNIEIGRSPGLIPPEKLAEEVLHIGNQKGVIKKEDLKSWMSDVKLTFLSDKDFEALWNAMDLDGTGDVDPVEFVVFLSACGPQFEQVYAEQQKMPKMKRLQLAARRLENFGERGEQGVLQIERKLDRACITTTTTTTTTTAKNNNNANASNANATNPTTGTGSNHQRQRQHRSSFRSANGNNTRKKRVSFNAGGTSTTAFEGVSSLTLEPEMDNTSRSFHPERSFLHPERSTGFLMTNELPHRNNTTLPTIPQQGESSIWSSFGQFDSSNDESSNKFGVGFGTMSTEKNKLTELLSPYHSSFGNKLNEKDNKRCPPPPPLANVEAPGLGGQRRLDNNNVCTAKIPGAGGGLQQKRSSFLFSDYSTSQNPGGGGGDGVALQKKRSSFLFARRSSMNKQEEEVGSGGSSTTETTRNGGGLAVSSAASAAAASAAAAAAVAADDNDEEEGEEDAGSEVIIFGSDNSGEEGEGQLFIPNFGIEFDEDHDSHINNDNSTSNDNDAEQGGGRAAAATGATTTTIPSSSPQWFTMR